jgi:hypothetical protein
MHYISGKNLLGKPGVFTDKQGSILIDIHGRPFYMLILAIYLNPPAQGKAETTPFSDNHLGPFIFQEKIIILYPA